MKQYRTVNNLMGWITFLIAATVYCLTIEPTASFWDCPEFITTGYKLEVGHPPGAPFFMLVANLFSQFASDPSEVAKMVNYMSALMSGACILFLFWTITHLVRKLVIKDEEHITTAQLITVMGSGLVGALAYTFSDTFWFSAVEGEVYAFSSLFTAVVFWLILKWEDVADQPHSDRWLVLIAYLTGLSIGVHLLNLLCLPAIVLIYYYKKVPNANAKGSLLALLGSAVLVAVVLYGMVPGIVKVGGWFELLFVNTLGMPFNTGVLVYVLVLAATLIWGVYESYQDRNKLRMALSFILSIAMLGIPFYGHGAGAVVIGLIVISSVPRPTRRWTKTHRKTSSRWANTWDVSNTARARCSTAKPSPRRWPSTRPTMVIASRALPAKAPSSCARKNPRPTRRTATWKSPDASNTNMRRTCSSPACTAARIRTTTRRGWTSKDTTWPMTAAAR